MAIVELGNVVDRIKDTVDKNNTDLEYYVGGEHFDFGKVEIQGKAVIKGSTIGPAFHMRFKPGDVLLMSRNPHLRKAARVNFEGLCSDVSYVCRTKDNNILLQDLLPFIFQTDSFWKFAEEHKKGSTNFFLNWSDFQKYKFDLPDINEQRELANILWQFTYTLDSYRTLQANSDELVKARFVEMFGDPETCITNANATVGDVARVQVGLVIKPTRFYSDVPTTHKAFRSLNVAPFKVKDNSDWVFFTDEGAQQNTNTMAHTGDVLVVRSGAPGTSCVVTPEYDGMNVIDLIIAHPDTKKVLPEYLCAYTNYPHGMSQIAATQRGIAQKHFNVTLYEQMKIFIPALSTQEAFVGFIHQVDKSKVALQKTMDDLNAMYKRILKDNLG